MLVVWLLGLVAAAVFTFISYGNRMSAFEWLEREPFDAAYGVTGLAREKRDRFAPTYSVWLPIGVVLCVLSALPVIVAGAMEASDFVCAMAVDVLLVIVALGVYCIIRVATVKGSFETLLQEGDYTKEKKAENKKTEWIGGVYWCLATAVYLGWSFLTMRWDFTWIVWPVAGVLFAAVMAIAKRAAKRAY